MSHLIETFFVIEGTSEKLSYDEFRVKQYEFCKEKGAHWNEDQVLIYKGEEYEDTYELAQHLGMKWKEIKEK